MLCRARAVLCRARAHQLVAGVEGEEALGPFRRRHAMIRASYGVQL
jgi:hypothetical protein